jgi:hypothetical protein
VSADAKASSSTDFSSSAMWERLPDVIFLFKPDEHGRDSGVVFEH